MLALLDPAATPHATTPIASFAPRCVGSLWSQSQSLVLRLSSVLSDFVGHDETHNHLSYMERRMWQSTLTAPY